MDIRLLPLAGDWYSQLSSYWLPALRQYVQKPLLINLANRHGKRAVSFFFFSLASVSIAEKRSEFSFSMQRATLGEAADYGVDSGYVMAKADWRVLI